MEMLAYNTDIKSTKFDAENMAELYEEVFPTVAKYLSSLGASFEDARDVFHDALVIYIEKASRDCNTSILSEKAYLVGISKHLWIKTHKRKSRNISFNDMEKALSIPEDYFPSTNDRRLLQLLKTAGKRCLNLLRAFYFQKMQIEEITNEFLYSNQHSASVQKHKCLKKLRSTVKEKNLIYDDFTE